MHKQLKTKGIFCTVDGNIPYVLERKKVKNFNLRIRLDGSMYLSVPLSAANDAHLAFLSRHESFILRAMARVKKKEGRVTLPSDEIRMETMEFDLLGEKYHFVPSNQCEECSLLGRKNAVLKEMRSESHILWELFLRKGLALEAQESATRREIISREKQLLLDVIRDCLPGLQQCFSLALEKRTIPHPYAHYIFDPAEIRIKDMKSRWGSCQASEGILTFNLRLLGTTKEAIRYVVCHELAHFVYQNHGEEYYRLLTCIMPDWVKQRKFLNR